MKPIGPLRIGPSQGAAVAGGSVLSSFNIYAKSVRILSPSSSLQSLASVTVNADGTITATQSNLAAGAWHTNPASGLGTSYWIIFTPSTGLVTTGGTGSRIQLTSGATWTLSTSGTNSLRRNVCSGPFQIWDAAVAGNMVASGTMTLEAEVQASDAYTSTGGGGDVYIDLKDPRLNEN